MFIRYRPVEKNIFIRVIVKLTKTSDSDNESRFQKLFKKCQFISEDFRNTLFYFSLNSY
jgi:hypothetical protein